MLFAEPSAVTTDPFLRIAGALVVMITGLAPVVNHVKGKRRDQGRRGEFTELSKAIKENHVEIRTEIRDVRETLTMRIDEIAASAENAQRDVATAFAKIGLDRDGRPDGNGLIGTVEHIGDRHQAEDEARDERLRELERERDGRRSSQAVGAYEPPRTLRSEK